jgi:hypothetical protein
MWAAKLKGYRADVSEEKRPGTVYWVDVTPPAGAGTLSIQDLFADGVGGRIAVQPCPVPLPQGTAAKDVATARVPRTAAVQKLP